MERDPDREGFCGDSIVQVENGEECDDGNKVVTDGCVSKYQVEMEALQLTAYSQQHAVMQFNVRVRSKMGIIWSCIANEAENNTFIQKSTQHMYS